jgi:hypothetical protein
MVFRLTLKGSYVLRLMSTTIITTLKGSHFVSVLNQIVQPLEGCGEGGSLIYYKDVTAMRSFN